MKDSPVMQRIITAIAEKNKLDLDAEFAHYRLEPVYNQPLIIEKHGKDTVAILHITSDGLALDPMIRFHISDANLWTPVAERMAISSHTHILAYQDAQTGEWLVLPKAQRSCAAFADDWASTIEDQKWIDQPVTHAFRQTNDTAWLISPDDSISLQKPANPENGFGLRELYNHLDCDTIEVIQLDSPNYILIGDENGKYGDYEVNGIATRLSMIDEHRDEFAGKAILCPTQWLK